MMMITSLVVDRQELTGMIGRNKDKKSVFNCTTTIKNCASVTPLPFSMQLSLI